MIQLIKRDFFVNRAFFIFILLFPIAVHLIKLPSPDIYTYTIIFMLLIVQTFHMEKRNKANRFLVSLPIKRNHFVLGRYMFIFSMSFFILVYISFISYFFNRSITGITFILALVVIFVITALSLPIYYTFQSVWRSVIVHYLFLIIGSFVFVLIFAGPYVFFEPFILFVLHIIDLQPFVTVTLFLTVLTYGSYSLSCYLFRTKDL